MEWTTITVKLIKEVCFIQFDRPDEKNTINDRMLEEIQKVFDLYEEKCKIFVFEGNDEYFCFGADFNIISNEARKDEPRDQNPGRLYDLWNSMIHSSCIMIAHVKGAANAGGIGFVSACDVVIASEKAKFSLSELLFGLMPAMVLPFILRRIGFAKSNYLTLTTKTIDAKNVCEWGLVDVCCEHSDAVLRQHLARMTRVPKDGIVRYKEYINKIAGISDECRQKAIEANLQVFSDQKNLERIYEFTQKGIYPWE